MLKSLEVLKNIKYDYSICDNNMVLDDKLNNVSVDEAISELELLSKRYCDNCKSNLKCDIQSCIVECAKKTDLRLYTSDFLSVFSCNNWKPKNTML